MTAKNRAPGKRGRAFRGLALVFVLSFLNLVGVLLTATALGGLTPWSPWQFIGMYGVIESASGIANVISPNIWRLPIAELRTSKRTDVKLAPSALLLPHWGALARTAAGIACLAVAVWHEGVSPRSLWLVPFVLALGWSILAISAVLARAGVSRPDLDVIQLVVRWGKREKELAPLSISASLFQFLLGIATIPAVKLLSPSVMYEPEIAPSMEAVLLALGISIALAATVYLSWSGRVALRAPRDQQREADETS